MKLNPGVLIVSALLILAPLIAPSWIVFILTKALYLYIVVMGVAQFLRGGQVTFGHAMFFAAGAYTVGFSIKWFGFREILVLLPMGGLVGLVLAALIGLILARYRGVFFAMLNLAFSMILFAVLLKFYHFTGGTDGLTIGSATLAGVQLKAGTLGFYYFALLISGIMAYVVYRFMMSPLGSFLRALGENEIRIEYTGESVRRVMYVTYLLTGLLGGISGVFLAFTIGHIVPEDTYWIQSGEFVFVALLGGFEGFAGPLLGAIAFEFILTYASKYMPYSWQMVLGGIMLLIILFRPGGLYEIFELIVHKFRKKEGISHG